MTKIEVDSAQVSTVNCDLMPCKINITGKANVKNYFYSLTRVDGDKNTGEYLVNTFRGRPLYGKHIDLPKSCTGFVCKEESELKESGDTSTVFKSIGKFDRITAWNWDTKPSNSDLIQQSLQWLSISEAIHAPIKISNSEQH